jgi:hypothetical protein
MKLKGGAKNKPDNFDLDKDKNYQAYPDIKDKLESVNTGSIEGDLKQEMNIALQRKMKNRFDAMMDKHYYSCLFFMCDSDRDEFLRKTGIAPPGTDFINGYDLAKRLYPDVKFDFIGEFLNFANVDMQQKDMKKVMKSSDKKKRLKK